MFLSFLGQNTLRFTVKRHKLSYRLIQWLENENENVVACLYGPVMVSDSTFS